MRGVALEDLIAGDLQESVVLMDATPRERDRDVDGCAGLSVVLEGSWVVLLVGQAETVRQREERQRERESRRCKAEMTAEGRVKGDQTVDMRQRNAAHRKKKRETCMRHHSYF